MAYKITYFPTHNLFEIYLKDQVSLNELLELKKEICVQNDLDSQSKILLDFMDCELMQLNFDDLLKLKNSLSYPPGIKCCLVIKDEEDLHTAKVYVSLTNSQDHPIQVFQNKIIARQWLVEHDHHMDMDKFFTLDVRISRAIIVITLLQPMSYFKFLSMHQYLEQHPDFDASMHCIIDASRSEFLFWEDAEIYHIVQTLPLQSKSKIALIITEDMLDTASKIKHYGEVYQFQMEIVYNQTAAYNFLYSD